MDLESHQFISYFEPELIRALCKLAIVEEFTEQKILFEEGEIPDFLYLVLEGQVEFSKRINTNRQHTITIAHPNDFFGEFGVLDGQPRSARATVGPGTVLAKISRESLMEILQQSKGSAVLNLMNHIIHQLRITTAQYVNQVVHKEKMVLLGEMVNTIIHDFKSPFNGIQLSSSMLKQLHPDEETVEWCDLIQAQIARMLMMAEEVLEFARGSAVLRRETLQVADLLKQFEKLNRIYFQSCQVTFNVQVEEITINADIHKLLRVLQNLITNAVEAFYGKGGVIEVKAIAEGDYVTISVQDNGPGIPDEIRDRFFEPFVTFGKAGGTGLGSAIAKSIIEAHDGTIHFTSQCPGGTTFYIRLPRIFSLVSNELPLENSSYLNGARRLPLQGSLAGDEL